jgi:hypothetical protein
MMRILEMRPDQIEAIAKDKGGNGLDWCFANIIVMAGKHGDQSRVNFFMDRVIGKVKETHETHNININADLDKIPDEVIDALLRGKPRG